MEKLDSILNLLECPKCHRYPLMIVRQQDSVNIGLRCESCGSFFPYHNGILDLLTEEEKNSSLVKKAEGRRASIFAKFYDTFLARAWFRGTIWGGIIFKKELDELLPMFDLREKDVVLDIGCGTGDYTLECAKRADKGIAIGLDICLPMLELLKRNAIRDRVENIVLIRGNGENLPFRADSLARICEGTVFSYEDVSNCFRQRYRILVPGGILFGMAFFKSIPGIWRIFPIAVLVYRAQYRVNFFEQDKFKEYLEGAGFTDFKTKIRANYGGFRAIKPI